MLRVLFFATAQNILKFCLPHIGTFGFAPTAPANSTAKPKEPILPTHLLTL